MDKLVNKINKLTYVNLNNNARVACASFIPDL